MWSTPESEEQLLNIKLNYRKKKKKEKKKEEERKDGLHENKLKRLGAKGAP